MQTSCSVSLSDWFHIIIIPFSSFFLLSYACSLILNGSNKSKQVPHTDIAHPRDTLQRPWGYSFIILAPKQALRILHNYLVQWLKRHPTPTYLQPLILTNYQRLCSFQHSLSRYCSHSCRRDLAGASTLMNKRIRPTLLDPTTFEL